MVARNFQMTIKTWLRLVLVAALSTIVFHLIYGGFFPNKNGGIGHDYSMFLPQLLEGWFWFKNNGLFEPFWFSPAHCGGLPILANPQNTYYSLPQWIAFITDPLTAIYLTLLICSLVGFFSVYFLLRGSFRTSEAAALLAAVLFEFNGFVTFRMVVGHLPFHGFALVPLSAWILLAGVMEKNPVLEKNTRNWESTFSHSLFAGVVLAYLFWSGAVHMAIPTGLVLAIIVGLHMFLFGTCSGEGVLRLLLAWVFCLLLSLGKLVPAMSFLAQFDRSYYPLLGAHGFFDALEQLFQSLFLNPPLPHGEITQLQWNLDRHEMEYGITWVPLPILLVGFSCWLWTQGWRKHWSSWLAALAVLMILFVPLAVNIQNPPEWNAFLKSIPIIKSSNSLIRWFCVYTLTVTVLTAFAFDRIPWIKSFQLEMCAFSVMTVFLIHIFSEKNFYDQQKYDYHTIVDFYKSPKKDDWHPHVANISVILDQNMQPVVMSPTPNDGIVREESNIFCYEPMFGYRKEKFPWQPLRLGPPLEVHDGIFNIKNPACYMAPSENGCRPGDHFTIQQKLQAEAFVNYRPFVFNLPVGYTVAYWICLSSWFAVFAFLIRYSLRFLLRKIT